MSAGHIGTCVICHDGKAAVDAVALEALHVEGHQEALVFTKAEGHFTIWKQSSTVGWSSNHLGTQNRLHHGMHGVSCRECGV